MNSQAITVIFEEKQVTINPVPASLSALALAVRDAFPDAPRHQVIEMKDGLPSEIKEEDQYERFLESKPLILQVERIENSDDFAELIEPEK